MQTKPWSRAITENAQPFGPVPLTPSQGSLPEDLQGTLYRNGPAQLHLGGRTMGHWFDGDGAILRVHCDRQGVTATYRFVETQFRQREQIADRLLFENYGTKAAGMVWNRWTQPLKNAANTSVMRWGDRLLALWEGGFPHALDPETLATEGLCDLGWLQPGQRFSAHPKGDPLSGEVYNFGVTLGARCSLEVYRCDRRGHLLKTQAIPLSGMALIHDFVLVGPYLVFMIPPVRLNPLASLIQSFGDALRWQPHLGTEILILDRQDLTVVNRIPCDPWYQWHFANGYQDGEENLVIDWVRFPDFATNQNLKEVASGQITTPAAGHLWTLTLDPRTGKILRNEALGDRPCEFPVISPQRVGQDWRYTWIATQPDDRPGELLRSLARYDRQTQHWQHQPFPEGCYPSEAILVPSQGDPEGGWLLTVVYDGNAHRSSVQIFPSDRFGEGPQCILPLPQIVPPSFHGTFVA